VLYSKGQPQNLLGEVSNFMESITVVIVDDHPIFRQGVINTLSLEEDLDIVADTDNGEEALTLVRKFKPDVVLMDVNLPGMNAEWQGQTVRNLKMILNTRL